MTTLTKIGNSQGVRIPKPLVQQAHLENANLEFEVLEDGLLIKPLNNINRSTWIKNIEEVVSYNHTKEDDLSLEEFLDDSDLEEFAW